MKKFLEELKRYPDVYFQRPDNSGRIRLNKDSQERLAPYIGKTVYYSSKAANEQYVGVLEALYEDFALIRCQSYNTRGELLEYKTTAPYKSLYIADDKLEVEQA